MLFIFSLLLVSPGPSVFPPTALFLPVAFTGKFTWKSQSLLQYFIFRRIRVCCNALRFTSGRNSFKEPHYWAVAKASIPPARFALWGYEGAAFFSSLVWAAHNLHSHVWSQLQSQGLMLTVNKQALREQSSACRARTRWGDEGWELAMQHSVPLSTCWRLRQYSACSCCEGASCWETWCFGKA